MTFLFNTEPFVSYFGLQRTSAVNYESFRCVNVEFYSFSANTSVLKEVSEHFIIYIVS